MKYFGRKSLSSFLSGFLRICWYVVLAAAIAAPLLAGIAVFISTPAGESFLKENAKIYSQLNGTDYKDYRNDFNEQDKKDWEVFRQLPLAVKLLILPYFMAVTILLLFIIKHAHRVFTNFKNDIVFNLTNVKIISKTSKLLIVFSILTFSFSSLLIGLLLLMLCEIIKSGTVLKEELDLTV